MPEGISDMTTVGIDYGRSRTGMAILVGDTVLPLEPVTGSTWCGIVSRLEELKAEYGELLVVLGHPLTASGRPTELSTEVETFAEYLFNNGFEVRLQRETGSTIEARPMAPSAGRDGRTDSMAAMIILKRYMGQP